MRIGRCITKKEVDMLRPGFEEIGCSTDIMDFMERKCSLKAECSIRIIDITTEITRPCSPEFLNLYLEAEYNCIKSKKAFSIVGLRMPLNQFNAIKLRKHCDIPYNRLDLLLVVWVKSMCLILDFLSDLDKAYSHERN